MPSQRTQTDTDAHAAQLGQLLDELWRRRDEGSDAAAEFLAQHPELTAGLRKQLTLLRELRPGFIPAATSTDASSSPACDAGLGAAATSSQISGYAVKRLLGRGGMGVVLEAYDQRLDRPVALKLLRPELVSDGRALQRFEREARAAAALRHPNVVTVYAVGQERGLPCIAMELVRGPSLATLLRHGGPLPVEWARRIAAELLQGLGAAHAAGLVHRDIKPSNILLELPEWRAPAEEPAPAPDDSSAALPSGTPRHGSNPGTSIPCAGLREGRDTVENPPLSRPLPGAGRGVGAAEPVGEGGLAAQAKFAGENGLAAQAKFAGEDGPVGKAELAGAVGLAAQAGFAGEAGFAREARLADSAAPLAGGAATSVLPATLPEGPFVKIADFGLARMRGGETPLTLTGSVLGTPEYMSPEQARGAREVDQRTDLYSAGVVLYELLVGTTPFRADTPTATLHRILHEQPRDPRRLRPGCDAVLASLALRLLAKRPEDRLASAGDAVTLLKSGRCAWSPNLQMRLFVGAVGGLALLVMLCLLARFLAGQTASDPARALAQEHPALDAVWVDPHDPRRILGRCGLEGPTFELYRFTAEVGRISLALVRPGGADPAIAVAGIERPIDGCSVFAYRSDGRDAWSLDLSSDAPLAWRDTSWCCEVLAPMQVGAGRDQLIVAGRNLNSSPARISLVDPRTGDIGDTFWHSGHIVQLRLAPDFFAPDRPAILARGFNNDLCKFGVTVPDAPPITSCRQVPVVLVLDPRRLGGLGPPWVPDLPFPPAFPAAYAFADLETVNKIGGVDQILPEEQVAADGSREWHVTATCAAGSTGVLHLDRNLNYRRVTPAAGAGHCMTDDFWRAHWKPIIQGFEYVRE